MHVKCPIVHHLLFCKINIRLLLNLNFCQLHIFHGDDERGQGINASFYAVNIGVIVRSALDIIHASDSSAETGRVIFFKKEYEIFSPPVRSL